MEQGLYELVELMVRGSANKKCTLYQAISTSFLHNNTKISKRKERRAAEDMVVNSRLSGSSFTVIVRKKAVCLEPGGGRHG